MAPCYRSSGQIPLRLHHCKESFPASLSFPPCKRKSVTFPLSAQGYWSSSLFPPVPTCSCTAPRRTAGQTSPTGITPPCTSSSSSPASWTSSRTPRSSCRLAWIGSRCPWLCSSKVNRTRCLGEYGLWVGGSVGRVTGVQPKIPGLFRGRQGAAQADRAGGCADARWHGLRAEVTPSLFLSKYESSPGWVHGGCARP